MVNQNFKLGSDLFSFVLLFSLVLSLVLSFLSFLSFLINDKENNENEQPKEKNVMRESWFIVLA
jgi:hypothetical protein